MTLKNLNNTIKAHREDARHDARLDYSCVQSRGIEIFLHVNDNRQDEPVVDTVSVITRKDVKRVLEALSNVAGDVEIWATGGFNGADSVHDLNEGLYDPFASIWDVQLKEVDGSLIALNNEDDN